MKNLFRNFNYEKIPLPIRRFVNSCIGFHPFGYPYKKLKIIAVTGTSGKTTTTTLLYRIAMALGYKAGLIGTVENFIGEEKVLTDFTTPLPLELNKLLSRMNNEGCEYVFMEASSHAMEERRIAGIKFYGAIFTNLSHDHLDFHKTMESYFQAKRKLFINLPETSFALYNTDDEYGARIVENIKAPKYSYGFNINPARNALQSDAGGENFHGTIKKLDFDGLRLNFNQTEIKSKLLGKFNAYNLLAVWSACKLIGFDMEKVKEILQNIEPPRGRFDHFMSKNGVLIVIDYAHKPDALQNVLDTINEIKKENNKIISVFGCGGDRDPLKRPKMGRIGVALSDTAIFTSDNSRSEDPNKIIADMMAELYPEDMKKVKQIPDRREAIREAVKLAKSGDIILCAGKGHEDYQEIKGVKTHFNDMEEFEKMFQQK